MVSIFLYDKRMQPIGPLDRAVELSYTLKHNELSTATITMAQGDPQRARITEGETFAWIRDGGRDIGVFRFGDVPKDEHMAGGYVEYSLKSAECTLLDDLLIDWHEIGGTGIVTKEVLSYILAQQTVKRWALGEVAFSDQYQYNFEDVTLLEAVMSLGEVIVGDYSLKFDTSASPWTVSFRAADGRPSGSLVYGRNVNGITRSVDATVVSRLYGRGYGEGDNQLTIASVNGGKDYLDAEGVKDEYDVRAGVHVDRRQTDPQLLKARMAAILEMGRKPRISYEVDSIDYYRATKITVDNIRAGEMVKVLDAVTGEVQALRVVSEEHPAAIGDPGRVKYTLSTGRADSAEALNEVLEKIGVQELYSQGATNMYSMQLSDNADTEHPLTMRFYVPGNVLRINSCLIYWKLEKFRTYTTLAKSGGGSARTSASDGGATVNIPAQTYSTGVKYTGSPADTEGSGVSLTGSPKDATGASILATDSAGEHDHEIAKHAHEFSDTYSLSWNHTHSTGDTYTGGVYDYSGKTISISGTTESVSLLTQKAGAHTHSFAHYHNMPHVHNMAHEHTIPAMEFTIEPHAHKVTIPDHEHDLEYGVFEGNKADTITLVVDGEAVPAEAIGEEEELDVAKYLKKNSDGKVTRGTWHEIEFVPDGLTRITADLFFQVFIQSRGAGDY